MSEIVSLTLRLEEHASDIESALSGQPLSAGHPQKNAQRALDLRVAAKLLRNMASGIKADTSWRDPLMYGE